MSGRKLLARCALRAVCARRFSKNLVTLSETVCRYYRLDSTTMAVAVRLPETIVQAACYSLGATRLTFSPYTSERLER